MAELVSLYRKKEESYFSTPRDQLIGLINRSHLKVLDVGCGAGDTGRRLLDGGQAKWVTGIELVQEKGEVARSVLNEVRIGDIEQMAFDWGEGEFDCFVFGDVLEHTSDPWSLLKKLRPFLSADGIALASIPNIKHLPVLANLIFHDDWQYVESGVLDKTHLRFFTRRTAVRLFAESGYALQVAQPAFNGRRFSIPNGVSFGFLSGFLAQQWLMRFRAA